MDLNDSHDYSASIHGSTKDARIAELEAHLDRLRDALQALYDEQNGPPLLKHKLSWEAAMTAARAALEASNGSR